MAEEKSSARKGLNLFLLTTGEGHDVDFLYSGFFENPGRFFGGRTDGHYILDQYKCFSQDLLSFDSLERTADIGKTKSILSQLGLGKGIFNSF